MTFSAEKLRGIQVLRFAAAFAIVLLHANHRAPVVIPKFNGMQFEFLGAGVDVFFVISGFIMVRIMQPGMTPFEFIGRRFLRVAPLYWVGIIAASVLPLIVTMGLGFSAPDLGTAIANMAFIPTQHRMPLSVGWTLNFEALFYVIFAFCIIFGRYHQLAVAATIAALFVAAKIFAPNRLLTHYAQHWLLLEFLFGVAIARLNVRTIKPVIGLALLVVGAALLPFADKLGLPRGFAWGVPAAIIVAGGLIAEPWFKDRVWKPFVFLGDASYSMYLAHLFVLSPIAFHMSKSATWKAMPNSVVVLTLLVAGVAFGVVVYMAIERPLTRAVTALRRRRVVLEAVSNDAGLTMAK